MLSPVMKIDTSDVDGDKDDDVGSDLLRQKQKGELGW